MPKYGRAVVLAEVGAPLEIREYPVPDPEPGAARVRLPLPNASRSDLHICHAPRHQAPEITGYIDKLGDGVTTASDGQPLAVGDRVVFQYFFPCGRCKNCL